MFRLGRISFLINDPVFYRLEEGNTEGIKIISSTPKQLLKMLLEGDLDMAPVASSNLITSKKGLIKLPIMSIHTKGPVMSSIVISDIHQQLRKDARIALTADTSASSLILEGILKLRNFNVTLVNSNQTSAHALLEEEDFALVIGDDALRARLESHHIVLDIGEEWWRLTGTPAVFAVTAAVEENYVKSRAIFDSVESILMKILSDHRGLNEVAESSSRKSGLPSDIILEYFRKLRFVYDQPVEQGLSRLSEITRSH